MTHKAVIDMFDILVPSTPFSTALKISMLNTLEAAVHENIVKPIKVSTITATEDQPAYVLPTGVTFSAIQSVAVDGDDYPRIDASLDKTLGYYHTPMSSS